MIFDVVTRAHLLRGVDPWEVPGLYRLLDEVAGDVEVLPAVREEPSCFGAVNVPIDQWEAEQRSRAQEFDRMCAQMATSWTTHDVRFELTDPRTVTGRLVFRR